MAGIGRQGDGIDDRGVAIFGESPNDFYVGIGCCIRLIHDAQRGFITRD